jgi:hypothetical protein
MKHLIILAIALAFATPMAAQNKFMVPAEKNPNAYVSTYYFYADSVSAEDLSNWFTKLLTIIQDKPPHPVYRSKITTNAGSFIFFDFVAFSEVTNAEYSFAASYFFDDNQVKVIYGTPKVDTTAKFSNTESNFVLIKPFQINETKAHVDELEKMMQAFHELVEGAFYKPSE